MLHVIRRGCCSKGASAAHEMAHVKLQRGQKQDSTGAAMRNNRLISVKLWLSASLFAVALLAGAASAGVMDPIPGDPVTIDSGKISGTLLASGVHATLECRMPRLL